MRASGSLEGPAGWNREWVVASVGGAGLIALPT